MKKLVTIVIAALAGQLLADTITWTGGAGTTDWGTAANWDLDRVPQASDSVMISGSGAQVIFTPGGDMSIQGTLTIKDGASLKQGTGGIVLFYKHYIAHVFHTAESSIIIIDQCGICNSRRTGIIVVMDIVGDYALGRYGSSIRLNGC